MAKRGQGEGTISKRPDGTWWARVTVGRDENGKQKRKAFYGKTRKEVQEKLTAALNDVNTGTYIEPSKMTVEQWAELWLKEYKQNTVRPSTFYSLYNKCHKHIIPMLGHYKLEELKKEQMNRFVNELLDKGLKPRTIQNIYMALSSLMKQAYENELIPKNPATGIKLPYYQILAEHKIGNVFTREEQAAFIEVAKYSDYGKFLIFILCTGIRLGEAIALTWDCVDLETRTIYINKSLTLTKDPYKPVNEDNEWWGIGTTKSKSGIRKIPLLQSAIDILQERKGKNDCKFVFCDKQNEPFNQCTVRRKFYAILGLIDMMDGKHISVHGLRHTFATRGMENGIELSVMQEILGHSSVRMTADIYTHVLPEKKKDSMEKLNSIIKV